MYDDRVTTYIRESTKEQLEILEALREKIHTHIKEVKEQIKWGYPSFSTTQDLIYLRRTKQHITLGFYDYHMIEAFESLLDGTGKNLRHMKITSLEDVKNDDIERIFNKLNQY